MAVCGGGQWIWRDGGGEIAIVDKDEIAVSGAIVSRGRGEMRGMRTSIRVTVNFGR